MASRNPTRDRWRAQGRCLACGREAEGKTYCALHREARAEARREQSPNRFGKGDTVRVTRWRPLDLTGRPEIDDYLQGIRAGFPAPGTTGEVIAVPGHNSETYTVRFRGRWRDPLQVHDDELEAG